MIGDQSQAPETAPSLEEAAPVIAREQGLKERVLKGGVFLVGREIISMGLSLIGVLMITRIIGPERYGAYAAALGIYQYIQNLGQAGIGVYLVRAPQITKHDYHIATTLLLAGALLMLAGTEISLDLIGRWVHVEGFKPFLAVLGGALIFQTVAVGATAQLERALDFRRIAMIEMSGQILYYLIAIPMVFMHFGAWSLVAGWCAQQAFLCIASHIAAGYMPRLAWNLAIVRRMLGYTLGFTAANWLWQLRSLVNPLIVGHFLGAEAVGQVGLGIRLLEMLSFVKTITWRLSIAALAKVQNEPKKLVGAVTHGMQMQMLALGPILLGFGWFGKIILPLIFGPRWDPVMEIYPFLALSYLTNAQFNTHSSVLYVLRKNWDVALFHIAHVTLFAVTAWFAIEKFGVIGYGWAEVGALASYVVIHLSMARLTGSPDYKVSGIWWAAATIGLFWQQLGLWTAVVPFLGLLWPASLRQLKYYFTMLRGGTARA
ncbi:MAG: oligosaccharide flippase family protein [Alphaproteobacteria bacterium]|nr:oligosaccharide flippase family protein [Alphaproteobacteria bacterium]